MCQNLISTSFDACFRLYTIILSSYDSDCILTFLFKYHLPLTYFTFIENSNFILVGTVDGKILLVEIDTEKQISTEYQEVAQHDFPILKIFFNKKSELVITVDMERSIMLWNFKGMNLLQKIQVENNIQDCVFEFPLLVLALNKSQLYFFNVLFPNKYFI